MGELIAAKFADLEAAHCAATALGKDCDRKMEIYASAILYKNSEGRVSVSDRIQNSGHATIVATFIGALAGLAISPLGAVAGAVGGALFGIAATSTDRDARAELLETVSHEIGSASAVLMANVAPTDADSFRAVIRNLGGAILHPSSR